MVYLSSLPASAGYSRWEGGRLRAWPPQASLVLVQQHTAGEHEPERWHGWYSLTGGGSGFPLIETDDPREVTALLQPYLVPPVLLEMIGPTPPWAL